MLRIFSGKGGPDQPKKELKRHEDQNCVMRAGGQDCVRRMKVPIFLRTTWGQNKKYFRVHCFTVSRNRILDFFSGKTLDFCCLLSDVKKIGSCERKKL